MPAALYRAALAVLLLTATQGVAASAGRVVEGQVNLRLGPGTKHASVAVLAEGEPVRILGEEKGWYRIEAPPALPVWVHRDLLEGRSVAAGSATMRAGPGIEFPVLGKLPTGALVELAGESGEWVRIRPPRDLTLWVATNLVDTGRPPVQVQKAVPPVVRALPPQPSPRQAPEVAAPSGPANGVAGGTVRAAGVLRKVTPLWRRPSSYCLVIAGPPGGSPTVFYVAGKNEELAPLLNRRVEITATQTRERRALYPTLHVERLRPLE